MATEECRNCRFSKTVERALFCRRYPPEAGVGMFPQVKPAEWCGEFLPMRPGAGLPAEIAPAPKPTRGAVEVGTVRRRVTDGRP